MLITSSAKVTSGINLSINNHWVAMSVEISFGGAIIIKNLFMVP